MYKQKRQIKLGAETLPSSCAIVNLDTVAPKVDVGVKDDIGGIYGKDVTFYFNALDSDYKFYKVWGDLNKSGVNGDLVGNSDTDAPKNLKTDLIDFNLSQKASAGSEYQIEFGLLDDVYNETRVTLNFLNVLTKLVDLQDYLKFNEVSIISTLISDFGGVSTYLDCKTYFKDTGDSVDFVNSFQRGFIDTSKSIEVEETNLSGEENSFYKSALEFSFSGIDKNLGCSETYDFTEIRFRTFDTGGIGDEFATNRILIDERFRADVETIITPSILDPIQAELNRLMVEFADLYRSDTLKEIDTLSVIDIPRNEFSIESEQSLFGVKSTEYFIGTDYIIDRSFDLYEAGNFIDGRSDIGVELSYSISITAKWENEIFHQILVNSTELNRSTHITDFEQISGSDSFEIGVIATDIILSDTTLLFDLSNLDCGVSSDAGRWMTTQYIFVDTAFGYDTQGLNLFNKVNYTGQSEVLFNISLNEESFIKEYQWSMGDLLTVENGNSFDVGNLGVEITGRFITESNTILDILGIDQGYFIYNKVEALPVIKDTGKVTFNLVLDLGMNEMSTIIEQFSLSASLIDSGDLFDWGWVDAKIINREDLTGLENSLVNTFIKSNYTGSSIFVTTLGEIETFKLKEKIRLDADYLLHDFINVKELSVSNIELNALFNIETDLILTAGGSDFGNAFEKRALAWGITSSDEGFGQMSWQLNLYSDTKYFSNEILEFNLDIDSEIFDAKDALIEKQFLIVDTLKVNILTNLEIPIKEQYLSETKVLFNLSTVDFGNIFTKHRIDEDLISKDYGALGVEFGCISLYSNDLGNIIQSGIIGVLPGVDGFESVHYRIGIKEVISRPIIYIYGLDSGVLKDYFVDIQTKTEELGFIVEEPEIDLVESIFIKSDIRTTFETVYYDTSLESKDLSLLALALHENFIDNENLRIIFELKDTFIQEEKYHILAYLAVTDYFTVKDLFGVNLEKTEYLIEQEQAITSIESIIEKSLGRDTLSQFERNYLAAYSGNFGVSLNTIGKDTFNHTDVSYLSVLGFEYYTLTDISTIRAFISLFDKGLIDETLCENILLSDISTVFEKGILTITAIEYGVIGRNIIFKQILNLFDTFNVSEKFEFGVIGVDFESTLKESWELNLFDIDWWSEKEFRIIDEKLFVRDPIGGNDYFALSVLAEDDLVSYDNYELNLFSSNIGFVDDSKVNPTRYETFYDSVLNCDNLIIYDPTITQRALLYWWQPGYLFGMTPEYHNYFTVNPQWGDPIRINDIEYPFYAGDPNYGMEIVPLNENGVSIENTVKTFGESDYIYIPTSHQYKYNQTIPSEIVFSTKLKAPYCKISVAPITILDSELPSPASGEKNAKFHSFGLYIYWTHYDIYGKSTIKSYLVGRTTYSTSTVHTVISDAVILNMVELFPGYDLKRDDFELRLTHSFGTHSSVTSTYGYDYICNTKYHYALEYWDVTDMYNIYRTVTFYGDEYFIPTDILPEVSHYKLYINMGCALNDAYTWGAPTDPMNRFVQYMTRKQTFLDLDGGFTGDDSNAIELVEESLFDIEKGVVSEWIYYDAKLWVPDFGNFCETTVIYSPEMSERDLKFWWELDYPVFPDYTDARDNVVKNILIGKSIYPTDWDNTLKYGDLYYGQEIPAEIYERNLEYNVLPEESSDYRYSTQPKTPSGFNLNQVYILGEITDGMHYDLSGFTEATVGGVNLCLGYLVYDIHSTAVIPKPGKKYLIDNYTLYYIDHAICSSTTIERHKIVDYERVYYYDKSHNGFKTSGDLYIADLDYLFFDSTASYGSVTPDVVYTIRKQRMSRKRYYLFVGVSIGSYGVTERDLDETEKEWGVSYTFKLLKVKLSDYSSFYRSLRESLMIKTDQEFIVKDFVDGNFNLKFYVNHSCGIDGKPLGIKINNDFDRWLAIKSAEGDFNQEYLVEGDTVPYQEDLEVIPYATDYANFIDISRMLIYWRLFESGNLWLDYLLSTEVDDTVNVRETIQTNLITQDFVSVFGSRNLEVINIQKDWGTVEFVPVISIPTKEEFFGIDNSAISIILEDAGEITGKSVIVNSFIVHANYVGNLAAVTAVYTDEYALIEDFGEIVLGVAQEGKEDEHTQFIEIIYVDDLGSSEDSLEFDQPLYGISLSKDDGIVNLAIDCIGKIKERVIPNRKDVYRDIGYVCKWVQIASYPYVIDWLIGSFVDYVKEHISVDILRFTTCFGTPPGGWPTVASYPNPGDILPAPSQPHFPSIIKGIPHWVEPHPNKPDPGGKHNWIRIPIDGKTVYIPDPENPPYGYEWEGTTSIMILKYIMDAECKENKIVKDVFYFRIYDADTGKAITDACPMNLYAFMASGQTFSGSSFGTLYFSNLEPNKKYIIKETTAKGTPITTQYRSNLTGNKYNLLQSEIEVITGDEGTIVYGGEIDNSLVEEGDLPDPTPGEYPPTNPDAPSYIPTWPDPKIPSKPWGPGDPQGPGAYVDDDVYPPIPGDSGDDDDPSVPSGEEKEDLPGYEGKIFDSFEDLPTLSEVHKIVIPVIEYGVTWYYHYIPADFILDLPGMYIELEKDFEIETKEIFDFDTTGFGMEVEEPFAIDTSGFIYEFAIDLFKLDEYRFEVEEVATLFNVEEQPIELKEILGDFNFELIDYDGDPVDQFPVIIANNFVFDGDSHELVSIQGEEHGIIYFQVDSDNWSSQIPTRVNAGYYTVRWYAQQSLLYNSYGSKTDYLAVTAVIEKATSEIYLDTVALTYNVVLLQSFDYLGDGEFSIEASETTYVDYTIVSNEVDEENIYLHHVTVKFIGKASGGTTLQFKLLTGNNYLHLEKKISIEIAEGEFYFIAKPVELIYTGEVLDGSDIKVVGATKYEISYATYNLETATDYSGISDKAKFYTIGTHIIYFMIKATNYVTKYGSFRQTIRPAESGVIVTGYSKVYDGSVHELVTTVNKTTGIIWYSVDKVNFTKTIPTGILVGKYPVYWYYVGGGNYSDIGSRINLKEALAEILPIEYSLIVNDFELFEGETVQQDLITPNTGNFTVVSTQSDIAEISVTLNSSGVFVLSIVGVKVGVTSVTLIQAASGNYACESVTFKVNVKKAKEPAPTVAVNPYIGDYDEEYHSLCKVIGGVGLTIKYSLDSRNWVETIPTAKIPGEYKVYWYGDGGDLYESVGSKDYPNVAYAIIKKAIPWFNTAGVTIKKGEQTVYELSESQGEITISDVDTNMLVVINGSYTTKKHELRLRGVVSGVTTFKVSQAESKFYLAVDLHEISVTIVE